MSAQGGMEASGLSYLLMTISELCYRLLAALAMNPNLDYVKAQSRYSQGEHLHSTRDPILAAHDTTVMLLCYLRRCLDKGKLFLCSTPLCVKTSEQSRAL